MSVLETETFRENLKIVRENIYESCRRVSRDPSDVCILAVTKNFCRREVDMAAEEGIRHIGENKVQEAWEKLSRKRETFTKHLIGHLQKNKVEKALNLFDVIQTVDSLALAEKLEKNLADVNPEEKACKYSVFIQVNVSGETTKSGVKPEEVDDLTNYIFSCKNIELKGVMGMAGLYAGEVETRRQFSVLFEIKEKFGLCSLSMGMSSDYTVAVEEGSTMVRLGTALFGKR